MSDFQLFTDGEIASLRESGRILRACLEKVSAAVAPGITTAEIDAIAEEFIRSEGGEPAFKGYHGFPATLCISVNDECVHGIPGTRKLREGDVVSLDGGVKKDGLYTDACVTVGVGRISEQAAKLLEVTEGALKHALSILKEGTRVGDISGGIQQYVGARGFKSVRALTGHGLGLTLHQFPDIPNVGRSGTGPTIPAGTLLAIEPIVSAGRDEVREARDGWTLSIVDGALSAHFEHTVLVTEDGCEIIA